MNKLIPVILCGGSGTRLWPVSREVHPKPFMHVRDGFSLLQQTLQRAARLPGVTSVLTLTQNEIFFKTQDEYAGAKNVAGITLDYVLEPCSRNTAPAITAAALRVRQRFGEDAMMLVMPADHVIERDVEFAAAVEAAIALAQDENLVTFGVLPSHPETGYGYIETGDEFESKRVAGSDVDMRALRSFKVKSFVEKPDLARAREYLAARRYLWNAGIFCFSAKTCLESVQRHAPDVYEAVQACWEKTATDGNQVRLDARSFALAPAVSIDYAVMEHAQKVSVVSADFGWSDVGTWRAVSELTEPDDSGNRLQGKCVLIDATNCFIHSPTRLAAAVGVSDLMIIDTPDALLVTHRDRAQDVKEVVTYLKSAAHEAYRVHSTVARPWGTYTVLDEAPGFKVKRIVVKRGASLSLQMHHHRAEHWVVVSGTAKVVNGESEKLYHRNESIYIPIGAAHRLVNPGVIDLVIIEVQSGEYLGEDDIVRFEDRYGRI